MAICRESHNALCKSMFAAVLLFCFFGWCLSSCCLVSAIDVCIPLCDSSSACGGSCMLFMYVIFFSWCLLHVGCNQFLRSLSKILASSFCWLCVGINRRLVFVAICGFAYYLLFGRSQICAGVHGETLFVFVKYSYPCVHFVAVQHVFLACLLGSLLISL